MHKKGQFPSRKDLDQAFHFLQDRITRIAVDEDEEMVVEEKDGQLRNDGV